LHEPYPVFHVTAIIRKVVVIRWRQEWLCLDIREVVPSLGAISTIPPIRQLPDRLRIRILKRYSTLEKKSLGVETESGNGAA